MLCLTCIWPLTNTVRMHFSATQELSSGNTGRGFADGTYPRSLTLGDNSFSPIGLYKLTARTDPSLGKPFCSARHFPSRIHRFLVSAYPNHHSRHDSICSGLNICVMFALLCKPALPEEQANDLGILLPIHFDLLHCLRTCTSSTNIIASCLAVRLRP